MPKLHKNKNTHTANRTISVISCVSLLLRASSFTAFLLFAVCLLLLLLLLLEEPERPPCLFPLLPDAAIYCLTSEILKIPPPSASPRLRDVQSFLCIKKSADRLRLPASFSLPQKNIFVIQILGNLLSAFLRDFYGKNLPLMIQFCRNQK